MIITSFRARKEKPSIPFILAENQQILLMPVGDIHEGSSGWPEDKVIGHLEWGMERGATFLGMGEFCDFTSGSQRAIAQQFRGSTKEELDDMIRSRLRTFLDLIKFTRGRWIGLLEGHHFWQFADGTTSDQFLCMGLDCHFLGTSALVRMNQHIAKHPEADCIVYCHHGSGAGRTLGGN